MRKVRNTAGALTLAGVTLMAASCSAGVETQSRRKGTTTSLTVEEVSSTTQLTTENQPNSTFKASPETCSLLLVIQRKLGSVGTSTIDVKPPEVIERYPAAPMRKDAKSLNYSQEDEEGMVPVNDPTIAVANAANSLRGAANDIETAIFNLSPSGNKANDFIQQAVIIPSLDLARSDVSRAIMLNCLREDASILG